MAHGVNLAGVMTSRYQVAKGNAIFGRHLVAGRPILGSMPPLALLYSLSPSSPEETSKSQFAL